MNAEFRPASQQETDAFYRGERTTRLPLAVNDTVLIKNGDRNGQIGWVVSLEQSDPEPRYLVELSSGEGDLHLPISAIEIKKNE
jgi:hypothetical protein